MATKKKGTPSKAKSAKPAAIKPVKDTLTKSALVGLLAEENGITRSQAAGVLASLENALLGSVHPKGVGEFTLPGLMKKTRPGKPMPTSRS